MFRKALLLFLISFGIYYRAFPAVFTVTSNADSGPGSFRDALTQAAANGSATQDRINFNLPDLSLTGRTITILSVLPRVSSNLIIDGSTQPGSPFGVSFAKICMLFNSTGQTPFYALTINNQANVEIYGLYLLLTNSFNPRRNQPIGIHIIGTNNFQLGDVQKGNVIAGFFFPFAENDDGISESSGLIVKSNLLSIQSDGLTVTNDFAPNAANIYGNVQIGGTGDEGNLLAKGLIISPHNTKLCTVEFKNNKAGVSFDLTNTFAHALVQFGVAENTTSNSVINVEDNVLAANGPNDVPLIVNRLGGVVNIVRNYINVDKSLKKLGLAEYGIYVQTCNEVHIGSNNVNDANYIGYCRPIFAENAGNLTFNKNSFFCETSNEVYFDTFGEHRTQCNTTKITSNAITGTATPGSLVDLYYTDRCKTCSPQTYFTSVTADANGKWIYNGDLSGTAIACATYNNVSSEFTSTHINTDNLQVNNACGGAGSITGIIVLGATNIKWIDQDGKTVGNTPDLLNLKPGRYKLMIDNGGCYAETPYYRILAKFALDKSAVVIQHPSCGNATGSVTGLKLNNNDGGLIWSAWKDVNGNIVNNDLDLKNVPAGTYFFTAKGTDTCVQTFGPVELNDVDNVHAPSVNNIPLCGSGDTFLTVNQPVPGYSYYLYNSPTGGIPVAKSTDGRFELNVSKNQTYYVSEAFYNCESDRTAVNVLVGLNKSAIPNAITPNGDGINDYWNIPDMEKYPNAMVQVFSRDGQKVYENKGYTRPFDGTLNGNQLPVGVYYYVINLSPGCNISGNLVIIR